jgi:DNA-binding HxlR family transcriptional regulator
MRRLNPIEIELLLSIAERRRVIDNEMHHQHFNHLTERGYLKRTPIDPLKVEYTITRLGKAAIAGIPATSANVRR